MRGKSLALQVKDFMPRAPAQNANDVQREILIPYSKLTEHLNEAERNPHGIIELLEPEVTKRKREQAPPEELELEDEHLYQQEESKEEKRAEAETEGKERGLRPYAFESGERIGRVDL